MNLIRAGLLLSMKLIVSGPSKTLVQGYLERTESFRYAVCEETRYGSLPRSFNDNEKF